MNFALYVEGPTERTIPSFLKRWLDPRLPSPIGIKPVLFYGSGDYLKNFVRRAKKDLESHKLIAVVGLLDLYGAPLPFPEDESVEAKYTWAKAELEKQVNHAQFRQHFAVHETEAWLLTDCAIFPAAIRKALQKHTREPESVNFQQPPARLLRQVYKANGRDYKKVVDGSALFAKLDPNKAAQSCPTCACFSTTCCL